MSMPQGTYDEDEYEYDDYDDYDEDDEIEVIPPRRSRSRGPVAKRGAVAPEGSIAARRAIDWGTAGGIVTVILLTLLYALSPVDLVPDLIPVAGQADDVVGVTAGTATAGFLAFLRVALRAMLASRIGRKGCVVLGLVFGVVGILAFIGLLSLLGAIF